MKEKLDLLINQDDYYYVFELLFDKQNKEYINNTLDIIVQKYIKQISDYELFRMDLYDYFENNKQFIEEYMKNNLKKIINQLSIINLINYKSRNLEERMLIKNRLDCNPQLSIEDICKNKIFKELNINYDLTILKFLIYICSDILKYEKKNISNIIFIDGSGARCLMIGDKIIKIGRRETFRIMDDKRYLKPVLRKEILIDNEKICFEITERASLDVNDNDLDYIIEEFKKKGKEWNDPSIDNIGKLIKPNTTYYKYPIYTDTGYIKNEESNIILPKGEIVIIDNDYMYDKVYTKK